jgi:hypothetical protein
MSSLGDAVNAIKSIILIEERIKVQGAKLDRLSDAVIDIDRRLVRLEATLDIVLRRATSTSLPLAISDQSGS